MQRADARAQLSPAQDAAARAGSKAMMPIGDRPFLDYTLSALADGGIRDVCLVVRPGANELRDHYSSVDARRLRFAFAEQAEPKGTADALCAARSFTQNESFILLNADNFYSASIVTELCELGEPGLPAFDAGSLTARGNIPPERVQSYALLTADGDGYLASIVEKPDHATFQRLGARAPVSMNIWAFPPSIFETCGRLQPSVRGELELADAVRYAMERLGVRFRMFPCREPVFDLSSRADIADVSARLAGASVQL